MHSTSEGTRLWECRYEPLEMEPGMIRRGCHRHAPRDPVYPHVCPLCKSLWVHNVPATPPPPRDALEGRGPRRWPQRWLDRRLEEVTKAVGAVTFGKPHTLWPYNTQGAHRSMRGIRNMGTGAL